MKVKKLSLATISFLFVLNLQAQFEAGIKFGLSSPDLSDISIVEIIDEGRDISISPVEADYGVHFGVYTRLSFLGIYLEPALLFNSSKLSYKIQDFGQSGIAEELKSETYRSVDLPLLFGTKFGFLRLQAGPVAHFYLDRVSDLTSLDGYSSNLKESTYGFQAGIGLDIWKFRFDVNYEGNLSYFGDAITIDGTSYVFDTTPSRLVANMGIRF